MGALPVEANWKRCGAAALLVVAIAASADAQAVPGYFTDPQSGIVYQQVTQATLPAPATTVYTPETVVETRPVARRTYRPVVEYRWVPKVEGRWNPFRQPAVAYHHVPETRWESRDEVVNETAMRTQWTARTTSAAGGLAAAPIRYEPVGRVAIAGGGGVPADSTNALAARLQPLDAATPVQRIGTAASLPPADYVARDRSQTGLRATDLAPAVGLPPGVGTTSIASLPLTPMWR